MHHLINRKLHSFQLGKDLLFFCVILTPLLGKIRESIHFQLKFIERYCGALRTAQLLATLLR